MIDRRDMLKLTVIGVAGTVMAGATGGAPEPVAGHEPVRFSIEGDMGAVRASSSGEWVRISGHFADRASFTLR